MLFTRALLGIGASLAVWPAEVSGGLVPGTADEVVVSWLPPRRLGAAQPGAGALPETMTVDFSSNGTRYELLLKRNRVVLPAGSRHTLRGRGGSVEEGPMPPSCFYVGEVADDPSGSVGVSTCRGGLSGLVLAHGKALAIEPAEVSQEGDAMWSSAGSMRHTAVPIEDPAFLHRQADIARFVQGLGANVTVKPSSGRRLTGVATKHVEVFVFNDYRRFQGFGGRTGLATLAEHTVSVLNTVTAIYRNPPTNGATFPYTVQVVLVGQQTFVEDDPWESTVKMVGAETEVSDLLTKFNEWGQTQLDAKTAGLRNYDNRVLLSGRDFDGNTVGLAGVSTMCWMARSGSINMCGTTSGSVAACAGVVAHEMGHNFGMQHDSSNNACPQSGLIMEAVGDGTAATQFSSCSASYITSYFESTYSENGLCLENLPTHVEGDPICGNGFVETGEDCDCGASDCTGKDACCNGNTCKFASAAYECSDAAGPCCDSCMFVASSSKKVCRAASNSCDLPEYCPGGTFECVADAHVYPGSACEVMGFPGLCSGGRCNSLNVTCKVDATRDFDGDYDLTEECAKYNDDCQQLVCHNASDPSKYACVQSFATHSKQMMVPDGSPCWFPGSQLGTRTGMCMAGQCRLPHVSAEVPLCGNGGIDYGEQCDCGGAIENPCCDCSTCKLKAGKQCSSEEPCCDSQCQFKPSGATCRAATGECDMAEVCSGSSGVCPSDRGAKWGTQCDVSNDAPSTCYGKGCLASLNAQCASLTSGQKAFGYLDSHGKPNPFHLCTALACCDSCMQLSGDYTAVNGEPVKDPWQCSGCTRSVSSTSFTVNGVTRRIYFNAALDGSILSDPGSICVDAARVAANTTCASGEYLAESIGLCLQCDPACVECTGPSNFDCSGSCRFGQDARKACAISADQVRFAGNASSTSPTTYSTTPGTTGGTASTTMPPTSATTMPPTSATGWATGSTTGWATGSTTGPFVGTTNGAPPKCVQVDKSLAEKHNLVSCPGAP